MRGAGSHISIESYLLSAAAGEMSFVDALAKMTESFDGAGSVLFELNRSTGEIRNWISPNLRTGDDAYSDHINSINPRMQYSLRHVPGHVVFERKFIDEASMDRHEFYDWLANDNGLRHFLGSRLYDDGEYSVFHSIEFFREVSHPETETIEVFTRCARSLGQAWRLAARSSCTPESGAKPDPGNSPWTPEHLPWSIFGLSARGDVVEMNQSARRMVERKEVLLLFAGHLAPASRRARSQFEGLLHSGLSGHVAEMLLPCALDAPLVLQIVPVAGRGQARPNGVSAVLYVRDPKRDGKGYEAILQRLYGLTPAEVRLVGILRRGISLQDAADMLTLSRNTARNQLQSVFDKTGARRQSELVFLLSGLIDPPT